MEGDGFEPSKAVPTDLQSVPFSHLGIPPDASIETLRQLHGADDGT